MDFTFTETILYQPLFNLLILIYRFIGLESIGWSVLILILLIRILTWPLFAKSIHYQKVMPEIQKEVKEVQKKFKGDMEAQGKATMEAYKKHHIHPFSYILVIFLQIPIFVALAGTFYGLKDNLSRWSYDFNFLAVQPSLNFLGVDLSSPNLVMLALAMLLQLIQGIFMAPKEQRKQPMLFILPLILGIVLVKLPAAFFLYWGANSVISIVQQEVIKFGDLKKSSPKEKEYEGSNPKTEEPDK